MMELIALYPYRELCIQSHKEWMIRSYVVTFSFVSFRWLVDLPFVVDLGNFIERAPTVGLDIFLGNQNNLK